MPAEQFEPLAQLLPDALLLVDGTGAVRAANPAAAALLQEPVEALVERRLTEFVEDSESRIAELLRMGARSRALVPSTLKSAGPPGRAPRAFRCEVGVFRPRTDGSEPLVLMRLLPKETATGRFVALTERIEALSREVLRRRSAEAQLQAYSERLRVTLASIGDAMIATDERGCVTMMNGVAQRLTGWSEAEAIGHPVEEVFAIINEHSRQPVESPVGKVLREGVVVGLANHTLLIARDGTERPIDDSGAPIRDADGSLIGVVLVFRDITERHAMERSLQRQTERLIEADRRKDEFLSMLAHELRNPLAPLHNGVSLLSSGKLSPPDVARITQMLQRQLTHMTRLVDDLLDVARLTKGRIELRKTALPLAQAVQHAVEMTRPSIEARGHALEVGDMLPEAMIEADPARLVQVFANLLTNAAKFTPRGGRISVGCSIEGDHACVSVRDSGVGIDPHLVPQVFEMFIQADRSLDRSEGGLGIGLTIVRALVDMHGGSVEARSEGRGRGSEFLVRLPLLHGSDAASEAAVFPAAPTKFSRARQRKVLVVDDNADAAESLRAVIEHWGHSVKAVAHASAALSEWQSFGPDTVLLDIGLPEIDGYELARRLRAMPGGHQALLVAVSGYGSDLDKQAGRDAGIDEHLTKPVDLKLLRRLLDAPGTPTGTAA
jgi:PAS domain S-box-containing protein